MFFLEKADLTPSVSATESDGDRLPNETSSEESEVVAEGTNMKDEASKTNDMEDGVESSDKESSLSDAEVDGNVDDDTESSNEGLNAADDEDDLNDEYGAKEREKSVVLPLIYTHGKGYPSVMCGKCGKIPTNHYCLEPHQFPKFYLPQDENKKVCGTALCMICKPKHNSGICIQCELKKPKKDTKDSGENEEKADESEDSNDDDDDDSHTEMGTVDEGQKVNLKVYTFSELEAMTLVDLRNICDEGGHDYGKGRSILKKRGTIRLILDNQNA